MLAKKGMSPLIVTILLIALAVALGAMIMNWSSAATVALQGSCEDVLLAPQVAFGRELLCYDEAEKVVRVMFRSSGSAPVNSVIYRRITPDFKADDLRLPNSRLRQGDVYEGSIKYDGPSRIHIELVPEILQGGEPVLCIDKSLIREELPSCTN